MDCLNLIFSENLFIYKGLFKYRLLKIQELTSSRYRLIEVMIYMFPVIKSIIIDNHLIDFYCVPQVNKFSFFHKTALGITEHVRKIAK